ncbi:MGMT family protein [Mucilaginibacter arboris]|uniref:Cysteine methyltransferase n=1 Tax=Mucilaginibacter arboris TaxID=2682090 RepID=A0A7K1SS58_9SPHI|nr:MGMT family protein [Mucilaginibacter arboris]MVN20138.1 cysteine methyltransferase [Mucilaginibacter arboris]
MENDSFYEKVYWVVRQVPAGRVTTYGAIAAFLGTKGSSRVVGYAMGASVHVLPRVPAHRVVNRTGLLTGKQRFGSPHLMQQLLENEGIVVEDDQIKNFKEVFWDPATELILP